VGADWSGYAGIKDRPMPIPPGIRSGYFSALLFAVVLMPSLGWAQSYNAAADFERGFTTHSNLNGVWSYGYSSDFMSAITLYDTTETGQKAQDRGWMNAEEGGPGHRLPAFGDHSPNLG
jgi:hypothetical protein